ncbi:hypothetical protein BS47DRAFT_1402030 [Hydnum rufescens UP504]|uniref:Secreted protein n=1 Tax=Hydnum rufescens UP504 TaxID=1448309 RepID=A0A9P6DM28_9AGAM|nr:hypothetical protein BS47DRAFT_1402030 [Hydnum rufescens UP504]
MAAAVAAVTVSAVILSIRAWTPGGIPVAVAAPLPANEASKVAMTPFSASHSACSASGCNARFEPTHHSSIRQPPLFRRRAFGLKSDIATAAG